MDSTPEKVNILLVNDRPMQLTAWQAILADLGEHVVSARSGVEALDQLLTEDFAVILLDVNMPIMDGFETAALIRQRPRFEHTPILFVTAINTEEHDRIHGYSLGAVDYIFTPIVPEILQAKVRVFVDLYRKTHEVTRQATQLTNLNQVLEGQLGEIKQLYAELQDVNTNLRAETAERQRVEVSLRQAHDELEIRVQKRTAELAQANAELKHEIARRQLTQRRREIQYAVTEALVEATTLDEVAPRILQAIGQNLNWELGELWLVERAARRLRWSAGWHTPAHDFSEFETARQSLTFTPGQGLAGQVWANDEPIWIPDIPEEPTFQGPELAHQARLHTALVLPIHDGNEVYGVVTFFSRHIHAPDPDLLQMLVALTSQIDLFIERRQAEEALRIASQAERLAREAAEQSAARTARLQAATAALSQALTPAQVAEVILRQSAVALNAKAGGVAVFNQDHSALELVYAKGYPDHLGQMLQGIPISADLPLAEAVRTEQPIWIESHPAFATRYAHFGPARSPLECQACVVIPLLLDGQALGGMILELVEPREFRSEEQEFLMTLGRQCAQALERARLYVEAQTHNAELEQRVRHRTQELENSQAQLRELSARITALREEERTRLSREIHDELGGSLTAIKIDATHIHRAHASDAKLKAQTQGLLELIDDTIQKVRQIATDLRPSILDDFGLLAALEWQLQEFQRRSEIECQLLPHSNNLDLDRDSATAVFRIFQETLTNVARHAQATRVQVSIEQQADHLLLRVQDNGRGISTKELFGSKSLGLAGMRERVHLLSGELNINGAPGQGTTVLVKIPLQPQNGAPGSEIAAA